jgi:hypothetical protein
MVMGGWPEGRGDFAFSIFEFRLEEYEVVGRVRTRKNMDSRDRWNLFSRDGCAAFGAFGAWGMGAEIVAAIRTEIGRITRMTSSEEYKPADGEKSGERGDEPAVDHEDTVVGVPFHSVGAGGVGWGLQVADPQEYEIELPVSRHPGEIVAGVIGDSGPHKATPLNTDTVARAAVVNFETRVVLMEIEICPDPHTEIGSEQDCGDQDDPRKWPRRFHCRCPEYSSIH